MTGDSTLKKYGKPVLLASITAIIFGILFTNIELSSVVSTLVATNKGYLALVLLVGGSVELLKAYRWQSTLRLSGYRLGLRRCLELELIAHPFNAVVPSKTGDAIKAYLVRDQVPLRVGLGTIAYVRGWDVLLLAGFGSVGLLVIFPRSLVAWLILGGLVVLFLVIGILWFNIYQIRSSLFERVPRSVARYLTDIRSLDWRRLVVITSFQSGALFVLSIVQVLLLFYAVGISLPPLAGFTVIPVVVLVGLLPVTIGGMGTRDAAFVVLFASYADPASLVAIGLLYALFRYWLLALVGLPFMLRVGVSDDEIDVR
jgi:uncharacterized protein (TIRG00374 family)